MAEAKKIVAGDFSELKKWEKESRRELIIQAAQRLFSEKAFQKVTAREIAKEAGVSPGTIYRYYTNLDDLFVEIFLTHAKEVSQVIDTEMKSLRDTSLEGVCEIYVAYLNDNMAFYQMMSHFMLSSCLSAESAIRFDPIMRGLMDHMEKVLQTSKLKDKTRVTTHALFSALNGTMISFAGYPGRSRQETRQHTLKLAREIASRFS
ncbi:TetR/AcrR family transcriptional regulator [bacterium]|nr:TetR/AcrR family transcriptional regulator [bacterium]